MYCRYALGGLLLITLLACRGPEPQSPALARPEWRSPIDILRIDYSLPTAPLSVTVSQPKRGGPLHFHLPVYGLGWNLSAVLEAIPIQTRSSKNMMEFDWEMPAGRLASSSKQSPWYLPMRISKGADHSFLIVPCLVNEPS